MYNDSTIQIIAGSDVFLRNKGGINKTKKKKKCEIRNDKEIYGNKKTVNKKEKKAKRIRKKKNDHEAEKLEETAPETLPSETKVPTTFYKVYKLNCKT